MYRFCFEFWCFDGIPVFCLFWRYLKAIVWSVYRKSGLLDKSKVFGSIFGNSGLSCSVLVIDVRAVS